MKDLFGNPLDPSFPQPRQAALRRGPKGETCRTCEHKRRVPYHDKIYYKCALMKWTHGAGTDIKLNWSACEMWKRECLD